MDNRPIGIFDSGIGGITVFSEIANDFPSENIIYLGDTAKFPYGGKSKETIIELTKENINFLMKYNVKLIVIACGTATSQALEEMQKIYDIPIIGIIEPTVNNIIDESVHKIGVIATEGTINSNSWENNIKSKNSNIQVINKACPLLAPMAEEGFTENEIARLVIKEYMKELKNEGLDKLILGCTHYPLFTKLIQEELGEKVEIINTAKQVSKTLAKMLKDNGLETNTIAGKHEIFLTDTKCKFIEIANKLFANKIKIENVKKAII